MGAVGRRPVSAVRAIFVELRAADGDIERRGSQTVDGEALCGGRCLIVAVASGRAAVAARNHGSDALRGGLLPKIIVKSVFGLAEALFALAETGAQHGGEIVVHDVERREVHAVGRVGAGGDDEFYGGHGRDGARPFHVQIGFRLFVPKKISGVGAVENDLRIVHGKSEGDAENLRVRKIDVAARHNGDALPGAVNSILIERSGVVDDREVAGRKEMFHARRAVEREFRLPEAGVGDAAGLA